MIKGIKHSAISMCGIILLLVNTVKAQQNLTTIDSVVVPVDTVIVNLQDYLPPLTVLIDSALANSPQIEHFAARVRRAEYNEKVEKQAWLNDIRVKAQYLQGDFGVGGDDPDGGALLVPQGFSEQFYYGVSMSMPLSTIVSRKNKVKVWQAEGDLEEAKRQEMINYIQEQVIETYNELFLLQRLLLIAAEAKESATIIMEQSEIKYVEGLIGLEQLGQNTDLKAKHAKDYEVQRSAFNNTYSKLERLVGVPFSKFTRE